MIINNTPHELNFYRAEDTEGVGPKRTARPGAEPYLTIEPSGIVPRVSTTAVPLPATVGRGTDGFAFAVPTSVVEFGDIVDLPEADGGVHVVAARCADPIKKLGLTNFATVNDAVRAADGSGRIVGCVGISLIR